MTFYIILAIAIIGFGVWWVFFRKLEAIPLKPIEIGGDEICKVIDTRHIIPNGYLVVGKHYSILLFKNDKCVYSSDEYKVSMDELLNYIDLEYENLKDKKRNSESVNIKNDIFTCYKVRKNVIKGMEFDYNSDTQLMDVYFGVLLKMRFSIRASFSITNKELFVKDFGVFNKLVTLKSFGRILKKLMLSKLYGSITSFMYENKVSYLHISLYKFEIEKQVLKDLNEYFEIYGIEMMKFSFQDITTIEDEYFQKLSKNIVERSKMDLLEYTYIEKMDFLNGIHEDLEVEKNFEEAKVYIK